MKSAALRCINETLKSLSYLIVIVVTVSCDGGGGVGGVGGAGGGVFKPSPDSFTVEAIPAQLAVEPGEEFNLGVRITNNGPTTLDVRLEVTNCPKEFVCHPFHSDIFDGHTVRRGQTVGAGTTIETTHNLPAGEHQIFVSASTSGAGANRESTSITVVVGANPDQAPVVIVTTPVEQAVVDGSRVTVTGTAFDPDGVLKVSVNGVAATSNDDFATWSANVPIGTGYNTLRVSSRDLQNNYNPDATTVTIYNTFVILVQPYDLAIDSPNQRVVLIDRELDAIIALDLTTNFLTLLSGVEAESYPFEEPYRLILDHYGMNAWVLDRAYEELIHVDLTSGQRSLIRPEGLAQFDLGHAQDMIYDALRQRILILFWQNADVRILGLDPVSQSGGVVAGGSVGEGAQLFMSRSMVMDEAMDRIIVFQDHPGRPYEVDPDTGDRTKLFLTEASNEMLQDWDFQIDAAFDANRFEIYIANHRFHRVDRLLLGAGEWIEAFDIPIPRVLRVALDVERNRLLVLNLSEAVYAVDLATGNIDRIL